MQWTGCLGEESHMEVTEVVEEDAMDRVSW